MRTLRYSFVCAIFVLAVAFAALPAFAQNKIPFDEIAEFRQDTMTTRQIGSVPAAVAGTVVAREFGSPYMHVTRLTLTNMPQSVINGTEFQGTQIYSFPEGRILVLGVTATLQQKTTSILANTINASVTGAIGLGTATASATTLATTMQDLIPTTAFTSSATINVAGTAVTSALAASAQFDGTSTAKSIFLNTAYATTTDVDADGTQTITGVVYVSWVYLYDY